MERAAHPLDTTPERPTYEDQVGRLTVLQQAYAELLRAGGTIDRALDILPPARRQALGQSRVRLSVARFYPTGPEGGVRIAQLLFESEDDSRPQTATAFVLPVCETFEGTTFACRGFQDSDAAATEAIVSSLEYEQLTGELPDLTQDCTKIVPRTAARP